MRHYKWHEALPFYSPALLSFSEKMKLTTSAFALTALAVLGEARQCQNLTIPISVAARQGVFNLTAPATNIAITTFILDLSRQGHNYTKEVLTGVGT